MEPLKLIVGLGNPGPQYERTRHNVGAVWVQALADSCGISLSQDSKFKGSIGRGLVGDQEVRLLIPSTFMNLSGESVGAVQRFYKLTTASILVGYDEMAFEPGIVRLKKGGGDNGHNGIKSVRAGCGNDAEFHRLRIGVGHPGDRSRVTAYLTQIKMPETERSLVDAATQIPSDILANMVKGDWQAAMNALHANPEV
ncbi:MAG: aminoacyl-tRNA hydrolase [Pseudomonadales bacterium]|nr:aminoacyl-tRNA hydrolase [Pseudomonadales bacterium]